jgi:hypothetical protein
MPEPSDVDPPSGDVPARADDGDGDEKDQAEVGSRTTRRVATGLGAVVALWLAWYGGVWIYSRAAHLGPPARNVCTSSCHIFVETECPTNEFMGVCPEFWQSCDAPGDAHNCL